MLRDLYNKVLGWSKHKKAVPILWITSVIDSIFFPIPPLVMLLPMMLAQPKKSFHFAFATTVGSIIGGLIAYCLGYFFSAALQPIVTNLLGGDQKFLCLQTIYNQYGFIAVLIWGFLPVPYKVITWASGFFHLPLWIFITASLLGRTVRYGGIALVFYLLGPAAKKYIDKHFNTVAIIGAGLVIVLGFLYFRGGSHSLLPAICS